MTAVTWAALALGLVLVPVAPRSVRRARALAATGRTAAPASSVTVARATSPILPAAVAGVMSVVVVGWVGGVVLALAAAVVAGTATRMLMVSLRARARRRTDAELLSAVRAMVAEVEAGGSPAAAFEAAAQHDAGRSAIFDDAAAACRRGELPELPGAELAALNHAWRVAADTGAPVAAVLARVAEHLATGIEQRRAVAAALSGPRSSAGLLAALPLLGLALGAAMQADPVQVLVATPTGRLLCMVGVALDAAGVVWTQQLTARAERA